MILMVELPEKENMELMEENNLKEYLKPFILDILKEDELKKVLDEKGYEVIEN